MFLKYLVWNDAHLRFSIIRSNGGRDFLGLYYVTLTTDTICCWKKLSLICFVTCSVAFNCFWYSYIIRQVEIYARMFHEAGVFVCMYICMYVYVCIFFLFTACSITSCNTTCSLETLWHIQYLHFCEDVYTLIMKQVCSCLSTDSEFKNSWGYSVLHFFAWRHDEVHY